MTAPLDDGLRPQLRGYRREQVDEVIRVLEGRVAAHDRAIAHLRGATEVSTLEAAVVAPESCEPSVPATALTADDASQPVASRAGRAGRAARTTRDRATPQPPPVPWRRSDLAAPAVYLLLAVWLLSGLIADLRSGYLSQGVQDQQAFEWYFGATAHNLVTLSNPLFTDLQNYPDGVNLMANASVLGLGIPLAPLTLLAGPSATFVLVEVLGLALTASAWFWLFRRRLAVHPLLAAIGAGFVGFAPGMISHANGHPNFVAQFLVPLIVDRVIRLAQGGRPRRDAVVLGLLAAWQVFIGEEVLLLTAIGLAIAAPVMLAHHREVLRPLARGLALGAAVCLAIVAVPLWWQFAGPRSYTSIWHPPGGNDLAQLWGRATRSLGADVWASAALSMNRTEENSFFGIPLLLGAVAVVIALWRRPVVQALGVVVVLSCWFSLGEEVVVNGRPTGIPAPGLLFEHVPILENVLPTRFALIAVPALGALLVIGAEEVRRAVGRSSASPGAALAAAAGAAGIILLPVIPTPLVVDQRAPVPQFLVDGSWKDWVDEGGSVLAAPAPWVGDTRALEWQAQARWGFPVVAGYFVGPDTTPERGGQYGATPTGLTQWMAAIAEADQPSLATPEQVEEFTTNLRQGRVDAIVLPQGRPAEGAMLASLTSAFGEPVTTGGVHVWDVRSVTDGAG